MGRGHRLIAFLVPAGLCAVWTLAAGKDVNWDLLNYHYYAPFQLLAGRLQQDFFAASAQSYLNPIGYLPFYLMVSAGWHSVIASVVLAVAHSVNLGLLYLLAARLFANLPPRERAVFSALATGLGAATAVFWATVGTSFLDPLLLAPMLAGLLLLLDQRGGPVRRAALAGLLFGAAAALKYSNAVFALAALPLAFAMPGLGSAGRVRAALAYIAGGTLALVALAGPWLALMWREFGNPVFPLMNGWFDSPHAPAANMASLRFAPQDFTAVLAFPFRMLLLDRSLYTEIFAPDLRFAALVGGVAALPLFAARRGGEALQGADWRMLGFFAAALALWLATSANGRYGMMVLLLAGVCLARVAQLLLPSAVARIALGVLCAVQIFTTAVASPARWFVAEPWSGSWLPYVAPERARTEPALYLTAETQPMAVVAPFVHPAASFVNFRGLHSLPADAPRLAALLERHRGRLRALGRGLELVDGKPRPEQLAAYDATFARIGYRISADDCFTILWQPAGDDALSRAANRLAGRLPPHEPLSVASCALVAAPADPTLMARERRMSALFDRMEKACPALFRGQTAVTEPLGRGWSRFYSGLDARLETHGEQVVLHRMRAAALIDLGSLSAWERGETPLPPPCR